MISNRVSTSIMNNHHHLKINSICIYIKDTIDSNLELYNKYIKKNNNIKTKFYYYKNYKYNKVIADMKKIIIYSKNFINEINNISNNFLIYIHDLRQHSINIYKEKIKRILLYYTIKEDIPYIDKKEKKVFKSYLSKSKLKEKILYRLNILKKICYVQKFISDENDISNYYNLKLNEFKNLKEKTFSNFFRSSSFSRTNSYNFIESLQKINTELKNKILTERGYVYIIEEFIEDIKKNKKNKKIDILNILLNDTGINDKLIVKLNNDNILVNEFSLLKENKKKINNYVIELLNNLIKNNIIININEINHIIDSIKNFYLKKEIQEQKVNLLNNLVNCQNNEKDYIDKIIEKEDNKLVRSVMHGGDFGLVSIPVFVIGFIKFMHRMYKKYIKIMNFIINKMNVDFANQSFNKVNEYFVYNNSIEILKLIIYEKTNEYCEIIHSYFNQTKREDKNNIYYYKILKYYEYIISSFKNNVNLPINSPINPPIDPHINPSIDPHINPHINPSIDPSINPSIDQSINSPINPTMNINKIDNNILYNIITELINNLKESGDNILIKKSRNSKIKDMSKIEDKKNIIINRLKYNLYYNNIKKLIENNDINTDIKNVSNRFKNFDINNDLKELCNIMNGIVNKKNIDNLLIQSSNYPKYINSKKKFIDFYKTKIYYNIVSNSTTRTYFVSLFKKNKELFNLIDNKNINLDDKNIDLYNNSFIYGYIFNQNLYYYRFVDYKKKEDGSCWYCLNIYTYDNCIIEKENNTNLSIIIKESNSYIEFIKQNKIIETKLTPSIGIENFRTKKKVRTESNMNNITTTLEMIKNKATQKNNPTQNTNIYNHYNNRQELAIELSSISPITTNSLNDIFQINDENYENDMNDINKLYLILIKYYIKTRKSGEI